MAAFIIGLNTADTHVCTTEKPLSRYNLPMTVSNASANDLVGMVSCFNMFKKALSLFRGKCNWSTMLVVIVANRMFDVKTLFNICS